MAMWDIEQPNPISGRKGKKGRKSRKGKQKRSPEADLSDSTQKLMKTTSDFTLGAMGIAVMSGMGTSVISALSKK